jgi:hypothetical protein
VTEFAQDDRTGVGIIDVHAHVGVPAADAVASESSAWAEQTHSPGHGTETRSRRPT